MQAPSDFGGGAEMLRRLCYHQRLYVIPVQMIFERPIQLIKMLVNLRAAEPGQPAKQICPSAPEA